MDETVASGFLPEIHRYKKYNSKAEEEKHVKFSPNATTVELFSPNNKEVIRIKNPKIRIESNPLRLAELSHIEQ